MDIKSVSTKEIHEKLTKAFSNAFAEAQKQGINVKNLDWFNSELRKDTKQQNEESLSA